METLNKKINQALVLIALFTVGLMNAQTITAKSSKITVNGTSSLHDWTMTSNSATFVGTVIVKSL